MNNVQLVEKLSKLTHEEWVSWSKHLIETEKLSKKKLTRWRELWKDYYSLSEKEKEKDRKWARKFVNILEENVENIELSPKNTVKKKFINIKKKQESYYSKLDMNSFSSTRAGFGKGIVDTAKLNKDIVTLTADLKSSVKLSDFEKLYPKRFFECGIAEQNMMSMAAGMCLNGRVPFVTSFAVFNPGRNWDQLRVSVCYSNHNVKILGSHAGLTTGPDGATHQALEDIAITRVLPNLTVLVPCDEEEARKATIAAAEHSGPVYIRVSRERSLNITNPTSKFTIGKANILDDGDDVTIIACGLTLQFALEAKEKLLEKGINAAVINLHTIKPLDKKTILKYAKKTKAIVTIEEHQKAGGMGSAVCEFLSQTYLVPVEIIGSEDSFGESGDGYELLKKYNISTENIIKKVETVIKRK